MDIFNHLKETWELTLEFIAPLIILTLVMFVIWFISFGLLAPVTLAGYTQSLLLMQRQGRNPQIKDLFSQLHLFLPLLGFALAIVAVAAIGTVIFIVPGIVFTIAMLFAFLYLIPLMTDRKQGLVEAMKQSWLLARQGRLLDQFVVVLIYLGISAIGSSTFFGAFFTQPMATIFMLSVYDEKIAEFD